MFAATVTTGSQDSGVIHPICSSCGCAAFHTWLMEWSSPQTAGPSSFTWVSRHSVAYSSPMLYPPT